MAPKDTYAVLAESLPPLFKGLLWRLPTEVPGVGRATHEQYALLSLLAETGGASMGAIASSRGVALNTATALVERLVASGLALREPVAADRRVVRVIATAAGQELVLRLREARRARLQELLAELDPAELQSLARALPALRRLAGREGGRA
jgi:DNA-binding MarR family transcriptional regulator